MPRDGAVIFGDLEDKLEVLHVACTQVRPARPIPCCPADRALRPRGEARRLEGPDHGRLPAAGQSQRGRDWISAARTFPDLLRLQI